MLGATTSTSTSTTATIPNTITAGLSLWENPLDALQAIPSVFGLLGNSSYQMFAIGALLPVAAVAAVLVISMSGGSSSSGERYRH
jgi:hypothetical protein